MSSCTRRRRRSGAATVEAVIVIPVLLVLLVGALWVRDLAIERQHARAVARSCAWRYALPGCAKVPDDCADPSEAEGASGFENLLDGLEDVPLIGGAIEGLLGKAASFEVERHVARSSYTRTVGGAMAIVCNTAPKTPGQVLRESFCDAVPICP